MTAGSPHPVFEPRRPALLAAALFAVWPIALSLPMLRGLWLASPWSDQYTAGYPFQAWSAEWWKRLGHMPTWNPEIFGGMPFVGSGSGDVFYPTWLLRLVISTPAAGNVSFFVHYILAGLFMYLLLRRLGVSWAGAVVGGIAYELSGLIASYPSPGHDGKLFASTMLPLACLGLVLAVRDGRRSGHAVLAVAVALSILGHFQLTYYSLIAAALFALCLAFDPERRLPTNVLIARLAGAMAAVLLGFGIAAVQLLPFFGYIPLSPRAQGYQGFAGSVSFAIPWEHVLEFFLKNFVGARDGYWGSNPLKLHSEYLGLPVVALAVIGAQVRERRRLVAWLGGIALLFLLVSLGGATPFYRLWWALMPLVKKTRAPGMAFFVVAFVTALFAALGTDRALAGGRRATNRSFMIAGAVVAALALLGVFGQMAIALATGMSAQLGNRAGIASTQQNAILAGALTSGAALFCTGLALELGARGQMRRFAGIAVALIVGLDLWINARPFWSYTEPYGKDAVTERVAQTRLPYRVLNLPEAYPGSALMVFNVPQVLGYHGNELRTYDDLLGGKNEWRNLGVLPLWDLLAVHYVVVPAGMRGGDSLPGFHRLLSGVPVTGGMPVNLFERTAPVRYATVVPAAIKADSNQIIPTLLNPRMDYSRLVLFTPDQAVFPAPVPQLPSPSPSRASVADWIPGAMRIVLEPPPPLPSYLLVAENWHPSWRATVDGAAAQVLRGDYTLLTIPVPAGAHSVQLAFQSRADRVGGWLSIASLLVLAGLVASTFRRERVSVA
ncbi:MAG TPA: YfhO family protein [Gemmatimonadales bacterium]|nr:YfhO family protein [Gemmatimonadales bacterium]